MRHCQVTYIQNIQRYLKVTVASALQNIYFLLIHTFSLIMTLKKIQMSGIFID